MKKRFLYVVLLLATTYVHGASMFSKKKSALEKSESRASSNEIVDILLAVEKAKIESLVEAIQTDVNADASQFDKTPKEYHDYIYSRIDALIDAGDSEDEIKESMIADLKSQLGARKMMAAIDDRNRQAAGIPPKTNVQEKVERVAVRAIEKIDELTNKTLAEMAKQHAQRVEDLSAKIVEGTRGLVGLYLNEGKSDDAVITQVTQDYADHCARTQERAVALADIKLELNLPAEKFGRTPEEFDKMVRFWIGDIQREGLSIESAKRGIVHNLQVMGRIVDSAMPQIAQAYQQHQVALTPLEIKELYDFVYQDISAPGKTEVTIARSLMEFVEGKLNIIGIEKDLGAPAESFTLTDDGRVVPDAGIPIDEAEMLPPRREQAREAQASKRETRHPLLGPPPEAGPAIRAATARAIPIIRELYTKAGFEFTSSDEGGIVSFVRNNWVSIDKTEDQAVNDVVALYKYQLQQWLTRAQVPISRGLQSPAASAAQNPQSRKPSTHVEKWSLSMLAKRALARPGVTVTVALVTVIGLICSYRYLRRPTKK